MYTPKPTDTRDVVLPQEMEELMELLAMNTHEVWAYKRLAEGWKYGPVRDDEKKEHPGLVPYDELSEEEKDYDRATSGETLKLILKMGYSITKSESGV